MYAEDGEGLPELKILITNWRMAHRTGTELYVRDLALALLRRGHTPVVYSPTLGPLAKELENATIPVLDDLEPLAFVPTIIHAHHGPQTAVALLRFPSTPAVYVCHDWTAWFDLPPKLSMIRRYIAVDNTRRDRMHIRHGIPEHLIQVIPNFVDLDLFPTRNPLPDFPKRALIFSNYATEATQIPSIREACQILGLELDIVGAGSGLVKHNPGELLQTYDLVFAQGRSALEAMAVGCAVIVCDAGGVGPMVTLSNIEELRADNLGIRTLQRPLDVGEILHEIAHFNREEAEQVQHYVRSNVGLEAAVDNMLGLYEEVLKEPFAPETWNQDDRRSLRTYLAELAPTFTEMESRLTSLWDDYHLLYSDLQEARREREEGRRQANQYKSELEQFHSEVKSALQQRDNWMEQTRQALIERDQVVQKASDYLAEAHRANSDLIILRQKAEEAKRAADTLEATLTFRIRSRILRWGPERLMSWLASSIRKFFGKAPTG